MENVNVSVFENMTIESGFLGLTKMNDSDNHKMNKFTVTLSYQGRKIRVSYFMGIGLKGNPEVKDVIHSLLLDRSSYDSSRDLKDFCSEFGYEVNRQAKLIYSACKEIKEKIEYLLGEDLEAVEEELQDY